MELIYTYAIVFSFLALVGFFMKYPNKLLGDFLYIKRSKPESDKIENGLFIIGVLRCVFGFRFFFYFNINK